jgi:DNA invertase Pin-like site-specific DNA recombinase
MNGIAYVRVSTPEQGRIGLGLEAQRRAIEAFATRERITVAGWYTEVETGKGSNALARRPELAAALKAARKLRGPVLVSKLDRLSRDVHFVSGLMAERVEFVVCDLGRQADPFVLHLFAALAEKERQLIADRTRAGLAVTKAKGTRLGMAARTAQQRASAAHRAGEAAAQRAQRFAEAQRPNIEWALKESGWNFKTAAALLNKRGVASAHGKEWAGRSIGVVAQRLGLVRA